MLDQSSFDVTNSTHGFIIFNFSTHFSKIFQIEIHTFLLRNSLVNQFKTQSKSIKNVTINSIVGNAIENVWITALMMSYNTHCIVDCLVWIIPVVIVVIIKPYLIRYVNLLMVPIRRETRLIALYLFLSGLGCFVVGYSTSVSKSDYIIRIAICTVGWTITDISLEICTFFLEKTNMFIDQNFTPDSTSFSEEAAKLIGTISALFLSFLLMGISGAITFKQFFFNCRVLYYLTGTFSCLGSVTLILKYDLPSEPPGQKQFGIIRNLQIQNYLPGYLEFKTSSTKVRLRLFVHFCMIFLTDIMMFYTSMWIVYGQQIHHTKRPESYCIGVRDGSLGICAYTLIMGMARINAKLSFLYQGMLISSVIFGFMAFWNLQNLWLFTMIIGMSSCVGIYTYQIKPVWQETYPLFSACTDIVERAEKVFSLVLMPMICMLIMGRDDVEDSIIFGILALSYCGYVSYKTGELPKISLNSYKYE